MSKLNILITHRSLLITLLIFCQLSIINCQLSIAQFDFIGRKLNPNQTKQTSTKSIKSLESIPSLDFKFDSIRPLNELKTGNNEWCPWLSPDGNRIYYTEGVTHSQIYMAEKQTGQYKFSNPHPLNMINNNDTSLESYCPWLTKDELNIYYSQFNTKTGSSTLYHAKRDSIKHDFSAPIIVKLNGIPVNLPNDFGIASLTQDSSQLYLTDISSAYLIITKFNKITNNEYIFSDTLLSNNYHAGAGKLTSDDLSYFMALGEGWGEIYILKRNSLQEKFTKLYYVDNSFINDINYRYKTDPYYSISNNIFVFVKADSGYVYSSEVIYLAYNFHENTSIIENKNNLNYINIFPNPVNQLSVISYQLSEKTYIVLDVYNIIGNKIERLINEEKPAGNYEIIYNTENLKNGIYLLRISDNKTIGYKKFIKV